MLLLKVRGNGEKGLFFAFGEERKSLSRPLIRLAAYASSHLPHQGEGFAEKTFAKRKSINYFFGKEQNYG